MPSNILKIGYTFNGEAFEYDTKVEAWQDLENATRELQMMLIEQVLALKPHVIERSTEISMYTVTTPGNVNGELPWLNLIHAANELSPKMFGEPITNVDGIETYKDATVTHSGDEGEGAGLKVTVTATSKHGNMILRQAAEKVHLTW